MMRPPTTLETSKYAVENYHRRHRANLLEMLVAREYVVYMKYKHRMKKSMRETYLERIAQIIAEAMQTTFSALELKKHFDKLHRSEREKFVGFLNFFKGPSGSSTERDPKIFSLTMPYLR